MGASYCLMLNASHHVTLSVCEFPDPQSASAGAQVSRKALRQIAGRTVHVKRSTTLSVIGSETNEASEVIRKRARAAFEAL